MFQHRRRDGEHDALGGETPPGENIVDQEAVNAAIAVLERMQEHKTIGDGGGMNHCRSAAGVHALVGRYKAVHKVAQVFRLRANEMDALFLPGYRLADIVLARPVTGVAESRIDDPVLHLDQSLFLAEILERSGMQQFNEAVGPG